ncbi:MAG: hypothetical protein AAF533_30395, partial [Acidobacteriota bacterium]
VAPTETRRGELLARGDGELRIDDVVAILRAAVGLAPIAWPEHELVVVLNEAAAPAVGFGVHVDGWPSWAVPTLTEAAPCSLDGGGDWAFGADGWSMSCVTDPEPFEAPAELLTVRYRARQAVDSDSIRWNVELLDESLRDLPGDIQLLD